MFKVTFSYSESLEIIMEIIVAELDLAQANCGKMVCFIMEYHGCCQKN